MRPLALVAVTFLLPLAAAAGCDEWIFTMDTRIDASGRLTRETRIEYRGDSGGDMIGTRFRLPPFAERGEKWALVRATALAPGELEPDFVASVAAAAESGREEPRNQVEWGKRDCVFFDHYTYREAYRDSVGEAERDAATEAAFTALRDLAMAAARIETDGRYDLARLKAYLDGPGRRLLHDCVRVFWDEKDAKRRKGRLLALLRAQGLVLVEETPGTGDADDDANAEVLAAFVSAKLQALFVPKGPGVAPYDPALLVDTGEEGKRRRTELWEATATAAYGSKDAAEKELERLFKAIAGDADSLPVRFAAHVTLPGRLLRTNGWVDEAGGPGGGAESRVFFAFGAKDVARSGHTLEVETAVLKPEVLARLPGAKPALEAADLVRIAGALAPVDDEGRAEIAAAVHALGEGLSVEDATAGLPEQRKEPFGKLVEIVSSGS